MKQNCEKIAIYLPDHAQQDLFVEKIKAWLEGRQSAYPDNQIEIEWFFEKELSFGSALRAAARFCGTTKATLFLDSIEIFGHLTKGKRQHNLLSDIANVLSGKPNVSLIIRNAPHINAKNVQDISLDRTFRAKTNSTLTKVALKKLKEQGKRLGNPNPKHLAKIAKRGVEANKKLTSETDEILKPKILNYRSQDMSYRDIARALNDEDVPTPGKLRNFKNANPIWHASTVRNLVLRYKSSHGI